MPANTTPNAQAAEVFTVRHAVINMLRELGMSEEAIASLIESGVVATLVAPDK